MEPLAPFLTVLTAMITPAVIISACASLINSTSGQANRVVDRLVAWSVEFATLADETSMTDATRERRAMIFGQLDQLTDRARLLQRSLAAFHVTLGLFVAASVAIGLDGLVWMLGLDWQRLALVPVGLSLLGAAFLLYGCVLLVREERSALRATDAEMDFLWKQGTRHASADLLAQLKARHRTGTLLFWQRGETTEQ
jgi:hypothetical protein